MSMYTQLLRTAIDERQRSDDRPTTGHALAEVLRCRGRLSGGGGSSSAGWALARVADQLAYDIALIGLAQELHIECHVDGFDQPEPERARVEDALAARGIQLDDLASRAQSSSE